MGTIKYDWEGLKQKFFEGQYKSLKDFAEQNKIPYRTMRKRGCGWSRLWAKVGAKIEEKTIEKTIEKVSEAEAEINARHIETLRDFQRLALYGLVDSQICDDGKPESLSRFKFRNAMEGTNIYLKTMCKERDILGLNKPKPSMVVTNNTINIQQLETIINEAVPDASSRKMIADRIKELQQVEGAIEIAEPAIEQLKVDSKSNI